MDATVPDPTVRPTLTDSESQTFLHSYRVDQFNCHCNVISRHAHLCAFRKLANTCYVCCSEVELRTVVVEERCMTATLIFCQNVNLACEFCMACNCARFDENLTSFDLCSLDTTEQSTDVITCTSLVEQLTEHLDTSYNCLLNILVDTDDLYFVRYVKCTTLYSTCSNCTTSCDREYVLYRHQERLICVTLRCWDPLINSVHELHDLVAPRSVRIFKSFQSRTLDNRCVISRELVLVENLTESPSLRAQAAPHRLPCHICS